MIRAFSMGARVAILTLAACSSSSHTTLPPSTTSTSSTAAASVPDFAIVLDDGGLHLPPGPTPAGLYRVSFADKRTRRGAEPVALRFQPSGPDIELDRVSAGHSDSVTLLQNLVVYPMVDDKYLNVPIQNQLDVRPTARYSTPVT